MHFIVRVVMSLQVHWILRNLLNPFVWLYMDKVLSDDFEQDLYTSCDSN